MQHTHDRRVSGVRRVPVERMVDVCGSSDPASAFQGRSVDVSGRGMQVRAAHLPELRAPIVVRFQEQGSDVIAEGEVVAGSVVVLDFQVAIDQQAVADDQILRFVATEPDLLQRPEAQAGIESQRRHEDGRAARPRPCRLPTSRLEPRGERACDRDGRDHPPDRTGEDQQNRCAIGQPGPVGHRPEPQQQERRDYLRSPETSVPDPGVTSVLTR